MLPILWAPGSIGSTRWIGDEYGAWAFANVVGAPIYLLMGQRIYDAIGIWCAPVCAAPIVILGGFLMDRLRVPWQSSLLAPIVFACAATSGTCVSGNIPPLPASAMPARRWDPDSLCVAYCWTFYFLAIGSILLVPLIRLARPPKRQSE